jgi:hypothetical protein
MKPSSRDRCRGSNNYPLANYTASFWYPSEAYDGHGTVFVPSNQSTSAVIVNMTDARCLLVMFCQFGIMLVHAVCLESSHPKILACFLERCAAIRTGGNGIPRLHPNVRKVNLLTERIVVPFLQFAEVDTRTVHSRPRNARNHSYEFSVLL